MVAVVIVGVISALVLPAVVSHYQEKSFDQAFQRETQAIQSAVEGLAVNENKASFFETMMYTPEEPTSYTDSAEKFIKTYLRPSKLCGDNNGDCFATRYYEYKDNDKKVYTPTYKGSCAKLKNGASICLTTQTGAQTIEGLIDINGEKAPNVLGKDLRAFTLDIQTQAGRNTSVATVLDTPFTPIQDDPCAGETCGCGDLPDCPPVCSSNSDEWDLTCCEANSSSITSSTHHCCTYTSIYNNIEACSTSCGSCPGKVVTLSSGTKMCVIDKGNDFLPLDCTESENANYCRGQKYGETDCNSDDYDVENCSAFTNTESYWSGAKKACMEIGYDLPNITELRNICAVNSQIGLSGLYWSRTLYYLDYDSASPTWAEHVLFDGSSCSYGGTATSDTRDQAMCTYKCN